MDIYLINLDSMPERLARMTDRLQGVRFVRISACDGRSMPGSGRLSGPQLGCIESHRLAWKALVDSGASMACILEDDVVLAPDFAAMITRKDWPADFDVIKIETMNGSVRTARKTFKIGRYRLRRLRSTHFGTAGYILSAVAARRLLAAEIAEPVDDFLFKGPPPGRVVYQMNPALCIQESIATGSYADSSISVSGYRPPRQKRSLMQKVARELNRIPGAYRKLRTARWAVRLAE